MFLQIKLHVHHLLPAVSFIKIKSAAWFIHVIIYTEILFTVAPEDLATVSILFSVV